MIDRLLISGIHFLLGSRIFKFLMPNTHTVLLHIVHCHSHPCTLPKSIKVISTKNKVSPFPVKEPSLLYSHH